MAHGFASFADGRRVVSAPHDHQNVHKRVEGYYKDARHRQDSHLEAIGRRRGEDTDQEHGLPVHPVLPHAARESSRDESHVVSERFRNRNYVGNKTEVQEEQFKLPLEYNVSSDSNLASFIFSRRIDQGMYLTRLPFKERNFQDHFKYGIFTADPVPAGEHKTRYLKVVNLTSKEWDVENSESSDLWPSIKTWAAADPMVGYKKNIPNGVAEFRFSSVIASTNLLNCLRAEINKEGAGFQVYFETAEEYARVATGSSSRVSFSSRSSTSSSPRSRGGNRHAVQEPNFGKIREGELAITVDLAILPIHPEQVDQHSYIMLFHLKRDMIQRLEFFGRVTAFQFAHHRDNKLIVHVEMDDIAVADKVAKYFQGQQSTFLHVSNPAYDFAAVFHASHWEPSQSPESWIGTEKVHGVTKNDSNRVSKERIRASIDVRTSVMLRDLPNRMSVFEINRLLEWICPGTYDFSYLRIDFENQHNVGYVFVNFLKAEDIIPFLDRVVGHRWQIYNSEKIAQLSYANIQGTECLVERFRNSAVSSQWPPFRPKLWNNIENHSYSHFHPNMEQKMPQVTNIAKFTRSCGNQVAVGLYTPGHRSTGSSRRHHSLSVSDPITPPRRTMMRNDGVADLHNITAAMAAIHLVPAAHPQPYPSPYF